MPERVVAGFSLRPVALLSQARDPRAAIGLIVEHPVRDGPGLARPSGGDGLATGPLA